MSGISGPPTGAGRWRVLGRLIGADLNSTADQIIPIIGSQKFLLTNIYCTNASSTPLLAAGGIYTAAGKTGVIIVAAATLYTALSAPALCGATTLTVSGATTAFTVPNLFFSLTVAQGSPLTMDLYAVGLDLT